MPVHIKIVVSVITLIVGALFLYFEARHGQFSIGLIGAGLSVFMVIAMWMFREPGRRT